MKERILYEDDFEKQLKEKADQFKMYPSDNVWNEVYGSMHTRRRRFVIGMSFLIGSILILAGTQLLSPTRVSTVKIPASKVSEPAKAVADLHNYTASEFSNSSATPSGRTANVNQHANVPFVLRESPNTAETYSGSTEIKSNIPERVQNSNHVKPIQPAVEKVSGKTEADISLVDLTESGHSKEAPALNALAAESIADKTLTHLNRVHNDRFGWEIYITPTLNRRYLNGLNYQNMAPSLQSAPIRLGYFTNVNGFVDNTPVLGYDIGGNILYRVSKNISIKAGLQFSYSRYYIKTYNSNSSQAAPVLSYLGYVNDTSGNNSSGVVVDKNPQHYQNKYYQLSIPIGIDMKVAGTEKIQLHLGATIQPSYLLNTDAYVLSDDFNTYIKDPQAFRRWNLNAGAELYISYAVGKIRWELGPQIRYQIFSTYKNSIPLQENMLNYGIRFGISKSIW